MESGSSAVERRTRNQVFDSPFATVSKFGHTICSLRNALVHSAVQMST